MGLPVLKSEIEIASVFHRLLSRVGADAFLCCLALVMYGVLRMR